MVCNSTEPAAHIIPNSLSTGNVSTPTDNIAYQTPPADVTDLGADDTKTIQLMCKFYLVHPPYRIPLQWVGTEVYVLFVNFCFTNHSVSQIIRFSRIFNNLEGTKIRILFTFNFFVNLGFSSTKLLNAFRYCIVNSSS